MLKPEQFGCKKCGAVVTVTTKPWTDQIEVRISDGTAADQFGKVEIRCKKCSRAVAKLGFLEAK